MEQSIVDQYLSGKGSFALARETGLTPHTIRNVLVRNNVPRRSQKITLDEDKIVAEYPFKSQRQMAEEHGVSQILISRILRKNGFLKRPDRRKDKSKPVKKRYSGKGRQYITVHIDLDDPFFIMAHWNGYVLEHRLAMARSLDRPLDPWETVHHIDGDTRNNDLSNLQLRTGKHGKGVVLHCLDCGSVNVKATTLD